MTEDKLDKIIDEAIRYYDALHRESDRAAAILAASHFEYRLREEIMHKFVVLNSDLRRRIFENGPLSTFSSKINIAFALGLYDEETRRGLHNIKQIRNEFAHAPIPVKFDSKKIADICRRIPSKNTIDTDDSDSLRKKYIDYLQEIEISL